MSQWLLKVDSDGFIVRCSRPGVMVLFLANLISAFDEDHFENDAPSLFERALLQTRLNSIPTLMQSKPMPPASSANKEYFSLYGGQETISDFSDLPRIKRKIEYFLMFKDSVRFDTSSCSSPIEDDELLRRIMQA